MPDKKLIIIIPESEGGRCPISCLMCHSDSDEGEFCAAGVSIRVGRGTSVTSGMRPGPECPQFQGE